MIDEGGRPAESAQTCQLAIESRVNGRWHAFVYLVHKVDSRLEESEGLKVDNGKDGKSTLVNKSTMVNKSKSSSGST